MAATTILLDLDGTVWNSRPWYAEIIAYLSGVPVLDVECELLSVGNIVHVVRNYGVNQEKMRKAASENGESMELYEGVQQTLDNLRILGTSLGVVSNLPGWLVKPLLESKGLNDYFATTITPRWGLPPKPKPQGILRALEQMGQVADVNTWFAGDGAVDAQAAKSAAVKFAWASYGYETEPPPGTSEVLDKFEDVLRL